jgi:hypothetical protein
MPRDPMIQGDAQVDRYTFARPADRRTVCRKALQHLRPGRCRGSEATDRGDLMVADGPWGAQHLCGGPRSPHPHRPPPHGHSGVAGV